MNKGQLPTKQLSDSNWSVFDHASHAPQLLSDSYYVYSVCVCVCVCNNTCAVVGARSVHGGFSWIIDNAPYSLSVFLVVDHLCTRVDVPNTDTPLVVTGGQLVLVVRIEEHGAGECERAAVTLKLEE